jgi:GT2 family glycosyltransferase
MKCISPEEFQKYNTYEEYPFKVWNKIKSVYATGCWNCMRSDLWVKSGGFNEDMTLWGYEDRDWRYRSINAGISWKDIYKHPLIHVNHPRRNRDVSKQNIEISKTSNATGKTNWL